jgi:hypothetical protein
MGNLEIILGVFGIVGAVVGLTYWLFDGPVATIMGLLVVGLLLIGPAPA